MYTRNFFKSVQVMIDFTRYKNFQKFKPSLRPMINQNTKKCDL